MNFSFSVEVTVVSCSFNLCVWFDLKIGFLFCCYFTNSNCSISISYLVCVEGTHSYKIFGRANDLFDWCFNLNGDLICKLAITRVLFIKIQNHY